MVAKEGLSLLISSLVCVTCLQSVHLEVQERASAFRYLLAELGILHIDNDDHNEEEASGHEVVEDLISFPVAEDVDAAARTNTVQVLPADLCGAERAQGSAYPLLRAIVAESFYSVHPKAQRKVPVPEGLALLEPFNKKAVTELLSDKDSGTVQSGAYSMSSVVFVGKWTEPTHREREVKPSAAQLVGESSEDESPYTFRETAPAPTVESHISAPDKTFYLQHVDRGEDVEERDGGSDGELPYGEDAHQTETRRKKVKGSGRRKGSDKSKRGGRESRKGTAINRQDMQPAGAVDNWSSGDEAGVFRNVAGVKAGGEDDDDDDEVGDSLLLSIWYAALNIDCACVRYLFLSAWRALTSRLLCKWERPCQYINIEKHQPQPL